MGRLLHLRGDPHEETQMLLPWYGTGQVDAADRLLIEAHLATCPECRDELAQERRLGAAIRDLPPTDDAPWARLADRLADRVSDRPAPPVWWRRPVRVAWFVAAQAAVILLCVGLVATRHGASPTPVYRALGDAPDARTGNVLVMFKPETPAQAVRRVIQATNAQLVRGPTATGAYLLAVAPTRRDTALDLLRARRDVTLVQPVDAPLR